jgi:hypothetical protein
VGGVSAGDIQIARRAGHGRRRRAPTRGASGDRRLPPGNGGPVFTGPVRTSGPPASRPPRPPAPAPPAPTPPAPPTPTPLASTCPAPVPPPRTPLLHPTAQIASEASADIAVRRPRIAWKQCYRHRPTAHARPQCLSSAADPCEIPRR